MLINSPSNLDTTAASKEDCRQTLFISVIVPVRNESRFIERTLTQLIGHEYDPERFEIIVVDGESTDGPRHDSRETAALGERSI